MTNPKYRRRLPHAPYGVPWEARERDENFRIRLQELEEGFEDTNSFLNSGEIKSIDQELGIAKEHTQKKSSERRNS